MWLLDTPDNAEITGTLHTNSDIRSVIHNLRIPSEFDGTCATMELNEHDSSITIMLLQIFEDIPPAWYGMPDASFDKLLTCGEQSEMLSIIQSAPPTLVEDLRVWVNCWRQQERHAPVDESEFAQSYRLWLDTLASTLLSIE